MFPTRRATLPLWLLQVCMVLYCTGAWAQAWLPDKGEISFDFSYSDVLNKHHYTATGAELDVGHTRTRTLGASAAWSPSDRFMLFAGVPYVQTKFLDHEEFGEHGPGVDTGEWNRYFQDLRLELHYQALEYPIALAPYVAAVIPTQDYPTLGHAATGRGLNEYWVGFFAGKSLEDWPAYFQLRYNYAFVEEVVGIAHDRSNLDLIAAYFLSQKLSVQAIGSWQWTHGGIDVPVPRGSPLFPYHDQLAAAEFFNLTGGLSWSATLRSSVYVNYSKSLNGRNAHKVDQSVTVGLGFRPFVH